MVGSVAADEDYVEAGGVGSQVAVGIHCGRVGELSAYVGWAVEVGDDERDVLWLALIAAGEESGDCHE